MFSLRYLKDIANLIFWVLWACLAAHTQSDTVNLLKISCLSADKNQLHRLRFSGDNAKIRKLLILGTMFISSYAYPK